MSVCTRYGFRRMYFQDAPFIWVITYCLEAVLSDFDNDGTFEITYFWQCEEALKLTGL